MTHPLDKVFVTTKPICSIDNIRALVHAGRFSYIVENFDRSLKNLTPMFVALVEGCLDR